MTLGSLLTTLRSLDIQVWAEAGQLRYSAPTGALTPALRAELLAHKAALLALLSEAQTASAGALPWVQPIQPAAPAGRLPLSFAQQRLWFLDQLDPNGYFYNIPLSVKLNGPLNPEVLQHSLQEIVQRHAALRTRFVSHDGQPSQLVEPTITFSLPVINLSHLAPDAQQHEVGQHVLQIAQSVFDLSQSPLVRGALLKLSSTEHVLCLTFHHIVFDGWSQGILLRELVTLYQAFDRQQASPLPPLPVQYADYTLWQRGWLSGDVLAAQLAFWKQQLNGAPATLELPFSNSRPAVQTTQGARHGFTLGLAMSAALKDLSQQQGVTLFMTLLAAFNALLYRYTGQADIVIGTPIANRRRVELEGLIGLFANTLALRTRFQTAETLNFVDLLAYVREGTLSAFANQDVPLEQIVEALQLVRDVSRTPLFQIMFVLQNAAGSGMLKDVPVQPGLTLSALDFDGGMAKFDLVLEMVDTPEGLAAAFKYNTDLFSPDSIARMAGHFQTLLASILTNPRQRIATLPLLTSAERHYVLGELNATQTVYDSTNCIHQLFEQQVTKHPEAVAVSLAEDAQRPAYITYGALNQRANQLAHHLRRLGVGPEVRVGVCLERSLETIISFWAVLKAGGVYVPIDVAYPADRFAYMLADTQLAVLLTHSHLRGSIPYPDSTKVISLDTDWPEAASGQNLPSLTVPENLAYIIYTSGSTGRPKGVSIAHRGLCNLAAMQSNELRLTASDRVLQFVSFSFDASIWDIVMALLKGAVLCITPEAARLPGPGLLQQLLNNAITATTLPPSVLAALPQAELPLLQTVVATAEACTREIVAQWEPGRRFFNGYGPTEVTVGATLFECKVEDRRPPIGKPFANTQMYLLDAQLQPVPVGVPGEIYVGSVGLARGYLNNPDLTAEKFIPNPFYNLAAILPGASRLYKTGDLARCLPDGNLDFLGRIDHQVKLRGFRIELEEIEAVLRQHEDIRQAVVVVRELEHLPNQNQLVAYVIARSQPAPTATDLRQFLKIKLPVYMVPTAFVMLDALPLTPNNKVDRAALETMPLPSLQDANSEGYTAPRTEVEHLLAEIWSGVLGVKHIGIHDNFFNLGGDSIISIQIVTRAHQAGLQFTPRQLFQNQTIAELAGVVGASHGSQPEQGPVTGAVPLTPIQRWFFAQNFARPHYWNQALLLNVKPGVTPAMLQQVVAYLYSYHDALRLRFTPGTEGWQQSIAGLDAPLPWTVIDLSAGGGSDELLQTITAQLQASLALETDPLCRVALLHVGGQTPDSLFIAAHHLIVDGVSWRILLNDLQTLCSQLLAGQSLQLPAKTASFKTWAETLAANANTALSELDYWIAPARVLAAPLPVDMPYNIQANTEASAQTLRLALTTNETTALLREVPPVYNTRINDVLLAALAQAIAGWSGSTEALVDLESHGRDDVFGGGDPTRTVGWFTSVFPTWLEAGRLSEPGTVLKSIKEQLRQVPNHGIGYGLLRYGLGVEALQALPEAQVVFNYLGQLDQTLPPSALFSPANQSIGPSRHPGNHRSHLLEISAAVTNGQMQWSFTYSKNIHYPETIQHLGNACIDALHTIIAHCRTTTVRGHTPSDFPLVQLSEQDLNEIIGSVEFEGN
jgi:amino acid adenylation domain-containing protein/non-ribosomal peptide synthase protein (TIGR01720 family)